MKKIFRPFWSFDVERTEEWLSAMAGRGLHFVKIRRFSSSYVFEEGDQKEVQYRIGYNKKQTVSLPASLVKDGWENIFKLGNWYILRNEKPLDQLKTSPHHEGVINHQRKVMYVLGALGFYMVMSFVLFLTVTMILLMFTDAPVTIEGSPFWVISAIGWGIGFIVLYKAIKLYRSKQLAMIDVKTRTPDSSVSHDRLKRMKRSGELIVKRRFTWRFSPDQLEEWLEKQEAEGYTLHQVGKSGIPFYFKKGAPKRVSYCADFQNTVNPSYLHMHEGSGWSLVYQSSSLWINWYIWAMEYEEGTEPPKIYSDRTNKIKHAKRMILSQLGTILPMILIGVYVLSSTPESVTDTGGIFNWVIRLLLITGIIANGTNVVRSLLYYLRVRKD